MPSAAITSRSASMITCLRSRRCIPDRSGQLIRKRQAARVIRLTGDCRLDRQASGRRIARVKLGSTQFIQQIDRGIAAIGRQRQ